ncbi:hypothetical protein PAPYR_4975 [Paratrimastix pyriformis]|uniref:Uncharacterized protein n=1 Tax=Paratrimastix pyriformis TaxID=342808 RepID=A0ABQ8UL58_9EUKA|nr:hypothetical protein PAPYR_4975 [Paratrimastix pyriformis]
MSKKEQTQQFQSDKLYRRKKPEAVAELRSSHITLGDPNPDPSLAMVSTQQVAFPQYERSRDDERTPKINSVQLRKSNFELGDERDLNFVSETSESFRQPPSDYRKVTPINPQLQGSHIGLGDSSRPDASNTEVFRTIKQQDFVHHKEVDRQPPLDRQRLRMANWSFTDPAVSHGQDHFTTVTQASYRPVGADEALAMGAKQTISTRELQRTHVTFGDTLHPRPEGFKTETRSQFVSPGSATSTSAAPAKSTEPGGESDLTPAQQRQALRGHHFQLGDRNHPSEYVSEQVARFVPHSVDMSQWEEIPADQAPPGRA